MGGSTRTNAIGRARGQRGPRQYLCYPRLQPRGPSSRWTLETTAEPPGARQAQLHAVSCDGPSSCSAVGGFSYEEGEIANEQWPNFTLAERYGAAALG